MVLIRRQPTLENGQIGAFLFGGEEFVKKHLATGTITARNRPHNFAPVKKMPVVNDGYFFSFLLRINL